MRALLAALGTALLLTAGCSTDAEPPTDAIADTATFPRTTASARTTDDGGLTASEDAAPASVDAVGPVQTVRADDAGEVDLRIDVNRLELAEVREASGWRHSVNKIDHDEVELDFHHDSGRTLRLEVELEDGRLKVRTE